MANRWFRICVSIDAEDATASFKDVLKSVPFGMEEVAHFEFYQFLGRLDVAVSNPYSGHPTNADTAESTFNDLLKNCRQELADYYRLRLV